ncbi:c-type cytochrome [Roseateles agri]|nr:c-type cytochrome [Paucibacter sp. R3-3]
MNVRTRCLALAWMSLIMGHARAADSAADIAAGKVAFAACASCHQVGPQARGGFGPQLNGILGRKAGSSPDYRYSAAMASSKLVWTEASLTAFILDPGKTVPGTKMRFFSLGYDEKRIAQLIAYLRTQPPAN